MKKFLRCLRGPWFSKKKEKVGSPYIPEYVNYRPLFTALIIKEINKSRVNKLIECQNRRVLDIAMRHNEYMVLSGEFSHAGFPKRKEEIRSNTEYKSVGECLAWGYNDPEMVVKAWLNSEGHRKTLINSRYKEVSIAVFGLHITAIFLR